MTGENALISPNHSCPCLLAALDKWLDLGDSEEYTMSPGLLWIERRGGLLVYMCWAFGDRDNADGEGFPFG